VPEGRERLMVKQAPTPAKLAVMTFFALTCFGLLLFLWKAFGGPTPLAPEGYRVHVRFPEATQLADQADVRISGVPVGKVVALAQGGQRTDATLQLDSKYAPLARDARAILRTKTLLGETYVELSPGSGDAPKLPEGGRLPDANVQPTTELDEVIRAFTPATRRDLKRFVIGTAASLKGRDQDLSDVVGNAGPLLRDSGSLLTILDSQRGALRRLVRDTGVTFDALGRNQAAVQTLVTAGDRLFATTAARDADLQRTLKLLPTFLDELRPTLAVGRATAADAAPVVHALAPAAPRLAPVLRDTIAITPGLRALLRETSPLIAAARTGVPAATRTVRAAPALIHQLEPAARDLRPTADFLGLYKREVIQSWMNVAAATQATFQNPGAAKPLHYLRVLIPITTEAFVTQGRRMASNRHNPYLAPGGLDKLATGLEALDCTNTSNPQPLPVIGSAPPCRAQAPLAFDGRTQSFPQLRRDPPG
jgi:phospholipid/cholesterol/gamma-HCH transport system substrate-binding protein